MSLLVHLSMWLAVDIDRTHPLEQVPDAIAASREGSARGKLVIEVASGS